MTERADARPGQGRASGSAGHRLVHDRDKTAGIVSRGVAAGLDLTVVSALMGSFYLAVVIVRLLLNVQNFAFPNANIIFTITGFLVVSVAYLTACWAVSGRTLGSVVMGLRVVNRKGDRLRPSVSLLRALLCTFFPLSLLWAAVDRRRRSIADILLRTRVIYSR